MKKFKLSNGFQHSEESFSQKYYHVKILPLANNYHLSFFITDSVFLAVIMVWCNLFIATLKLAVLFFG